jgi:phosphatidylglycerol:prolipoprotein diacylglycerol transferase
VAFVLPTAAIVNWTIGAPGMPMRDFLGLALPLILAFGRVGCFLGGCCYGVRWHRGILYPPDIWAQKKAVGRPYAPDVDPGGRVFPMQLVEASFNLSACACLWLRGILTGFDGRALPLYLIAYSTFRFVAEYFRGDPSRRYWGPLSEAQWLAIALSASCVLLLLSEHW